MDCGDISNLTQEQIREIANGGGVPPHWLSEESLVEELRRIRLTLTPFLEGIPTPGNIGELIRQIAKETDLRLPAGATRTYQRRISDKTVAFALSAVEVNLTDPEVGKNRANFSILLFSQKGDWILLQVGHTTGHRSNYVTYVKARTLTDVGVLKLAESHENKATMLTEIQRQLVGIVDNHASDLEEKIYSLERLSEELSKFTIDLLFQQTQ